MLHFKFVGDGVMIEVSWSQDAVWEVCLKEQRFFTNSPIHIASKINNPYSLKSDSRDSPRQDNSGSRSKWLHA